MRQRATRSDARVRKIQRSIELYYGLPQGSVRLVNPDKTLIHPSAGGVSKSMLKQSRLNFDKIEKCE